MLRKNLEAINLGLESFAENLTAQGVPVVHVDWKPPAGGNDVLIRALAKLKEPVLAAKIEKANKLALEKMMECSSNSYRCWSGKRFDPWHEIQFTPACWSSDHL